CKKLKYSSQPSIIAKLVKIAGVDNDILKTIFAFSKTEKRKNYGTILYNYWDKHNKAIAVVVLILSIIIYSRFSNNDRQTESRPSSGNLYIDSNKTANAPTIQNSPTNDSLRINLDSSNSLRDVSVWDSTNYSTGNSPGCFNFTPRYSRALNNRLEINVGSTTD